MTAIEYMLRKSHGSFSAGTRVTIKEQGKHTHLVRTRSPIDGEYKEFLVPVDKLMTRRVRSGF